MLQLTSRQCFYYLRSQTRMLATATKATKVGIIGCGNVGNAIAHNLVRNEYQVVGMCDVDKPKLSAMPKGIPSCSTAREVTELADVLVTALPKPPNVKAAAEGPDGILKGLSKDKVWIDHSTTDYEQTQAFESLARDVGAHILEAPITGGLKALKRGQMVVHVGGDLAVCDAMRPVLSASYSEIFHVGQIGSAMVVKVVSNMLACVHIVAMGEVLMLAKRANIDLKKFWEAIRVSAGTSFIWETGAPLIFNGQYDPGFSLELQNKDLQLGYDMARKYKVPMDLHQLTLSIYRRTQYQMGDLAGCYSPPKTIEIALNESLNIPNFKDWSYDNSIIDGSLHVKHKNIK